MKERVLKIVNGFLGRFNFIIVGKEWLRRNTFRIVDLRPSKTRITPMDILSFYSTQDLMYVIDVPITQIAKSKLLEAQIQTLKIREKENNISDNYAESESFKFLVSFYETYQPKNVAERLGLDIADSDFLKNHPLYAVLPWDNSKPEESYKKDLNIFAKEFLENTGLQYNNSDGIDEFGPVSNRVIELEYKRLIKICDSIKEKGYDEKHGYPKGKSVFYYNDEDYMLSVIGGRHRTAAMIALGFENISLTLSKDKSYIVREEEVKTWYHVRSGLYTEEQALEIFKNRIAI